MRSVMVLARQTSLEALADQSHVSSRQTWASFGFPRLCHFLLAAPLRSFLYLRDQFSASCNSRPHQDVHRIICHCVLIRSHFFKLLDASAVLPASPHLLLSHTHVRLRQDSHTHLTIPVLSDAGHMA